MLWGGRNTANKYHGHVWGVLAVSQPHWVCPHSWHVFFSSLNCSGSRLLCRQWALGCVDFPGLSCSGSGSQVFHKGADSIRPVFCVLPRSEQLGDQVLGERTLPSCAVRLIPSPVPAAWLSWVRSGSIVSGVLCVSSGELISGYDPPSGCQLSRTQ